MQEFLISLLYYIFTHPRGIFVAKKLSDSIQLERININWLKHWFWNNSVGFVKGLGKFFRESRKTDPHQRLINYGEYCLNSVVRARRNSRNARFNPARNRDNNTVVNMINVIQEMGFYYFIIQVPRFRDANVIFQTICRIPYPELLHPAITSWIFAQVRMVFFLFSCIRLEMFLQILSRDNKGRDEQRERTKWTE